MEQVPTNNPEEQKEIETISIVGLICGLGFLFGLMYMATFIGASFTGMG